MSLNKQVLPGQFCKLTSSKVNSCLLGNPTTSYFVRIFTRRSQQRRSSFVSGQAINYDNMNVYKSCKIVYFLFSQFRMYERKVVDIVDVAYISKFSGNVYIIPFYQRKVKNEIANHFNHACMKVSSITCLSTCSQLPRDDQKSNQIKSNDGEDQIKFYRLYATTREKQSTMEKVSSQANLSGKLRLPIQ